MARTLTSKRLRAALFFAYDGRCAICQKELSKSWHADHIIPYRITQETNIYNMQPLCSACNLKKGGRYERKV